MLEFNADPLEFFRRLYSQAEQGCLEARAIDLSGALTPRSVSEWFPLRENEKEVSYRNAIEWAGKVNAGRYDLFFGVNPRCRRGQEDIDVLDAVSLWTDIDGLASFEEAQATLQHIMGNLPPDAAVFSGGGLHVYWFLKEPVNPSDPEWSRYKRALRAAALQYGGDLKSTNESRVLRFPGSHSWKRGVDTKLWLSSTPARQGLFRAKS